MDKEIRNAFRALMCHLSGERPVDMPRRRWVYNIYRGVRDLSLQETRGTDKSGWRGMVIAALGWCSQ